MRFHNVSIVEMYSYHHRAGPPASHLPESILMTDPGRQADPLAAVAAVAPGSAVILRNYQDPGRRGLAHDMAALCRRIGVILIVAGDARLAREVGAGGLHLPEWQVRRGPRHWRAWRRPDWLVTAAAHSPAALMNANKAGATAALLSPVFSSLSHPANKRPALGPLRFTRFVHQSPLPVYALGGVGRRQARRLKNSGAAGIAGIGWAEEGGVWL
jgi:thiamine-phosphate pyrophosphorylase